jgi:hypothetical protein
VNECRSGCRFAGESRFTPYAELSKVRLAVAPFQVRAEERRKSGAGRRVRSRGHGAILTQIMVALAPPARNAAIIIG